MKLLLLIMVWWLALGQGSALAAPAKEAASPPLPAEGIRVVPPSPGLPAAVRDFSGTWYGDWVDPKNPENRIREILVVEEIAALDKVKVIFSWGECPACQIQAGWQRFSGKITDLCVDWPKLDGSVTPAAAKALGEKKILVFQHPEGRAFLFVLSEDGRMLGTDGAAHIWMSRLGQPAAAAKETADAGLAGAKSARFYVNRGGEHLQKGQFDLAIADFTQAVKINPGDAVAYHNRGVAQERSGRYDLAIADATKALELNPKLAEAYSGRGTAFEGQGRYDQAIADCTQALAINPRYAQAYHNRGVAYERTGQYDQAIADLSQALEINPKFAEAYSNRGVVYERKGQYDQAIADFTRALELNLGDAKTYRDRGLAHDGKGQHDQAIADFTRALKLGPRDGLAYQYRAMSHFGKKEFAKAWEDVRTAQSLGSKVAPEFLQDLEKASGRKN